jgi:hypothetical protein
MEPRVWGWRLRASLLSSIEVEILKSGWRKSGS